jgi:hypothetical protein
MAKSFDQEAYNKEEFSGPLYKHHRRDSLGKKEAIVFFLVSELKDRETSPGHVLILMREKDSTEPWPTNNGPVVRWEHPSQPDSKYDLWIEQGKAYACKVFEPKSMPSWNIAWDGTSFSSRMDTAAVQGQRPPPPPRAPELFTSLLVPVPRPPSLEPKSDEQPTEQGGCPVESFIS